MFPSKVVFIGLWNRKRLRTWDFPGGPMAKTPHSQCRGPGFDPWSGNKILYASVEDPTCCK